MNKATYKMHHRLIRINKRKLLSCVSIYHALAPSLVDSDLLFKLDRLAAQVDMLAYAAKFGLKIYQRYN